MTIVLVLIATAYVLGKSGLLARAIELAARQDAKTADESDPA